MKQTYSTERTNERAGQKQYNIPPAIQPKKGNQRFSMLQAATITVAVLCVFLIAFGIFMANQLNLITPPWSSARPAVTRTAAGIEVPDLIGKEYIIAKREIESMNLKLEIEGSVKEGYIIEQSQIIGSHIEEGGTISVKLDPNSGIITPAPTP